MVETKAKSPKIDRLKVSTEFAHCFCVDSVGKAGGLAIFWKAGVEMEEVYSDRFVIALLIYSDPPDAAWLLIAVHGPPYLALRKKFWSLMENIIGSFSGLWLMIGDLNSISGNSEKKGGSQKGESLFRSFCNFVHNVGTIDLGFSGSKFTWSNRRVGLANIRERLDRGLYTHLDLSKGARPFRFKAMWTRDDSSYEVVNNAWAIFVEGSQHSQLAKRSQSIRKEFLDNLKIEAALTLELNEWLECEAIEVEVEIKKIVEVVHSFKSSKKKHGSVGFKLDFHKAYDILEWNFILAVLRNLGFDQRFITLIYQCISMREGLAFRAFESFNEVMIAKLAWWVLSRRDSFCVQVLRAKYKVGCNWLLKNPSKNASFVWRGTLGFLIYLILFLNPVIPTKICKCLVVAQLMKEDKSGWNEEQLHLLFDDAMVSTIKNIPRWCVGQEDNGFGTNGNPVMGRIWKAFIHERLKMHLWRIASNLLPTKDSLARYVPDIDTTCGLCTDVSVEEVLRKLSCLSLEYQKRAVSPNPNMETSGIEVWNRPRQGCIKFNWDAAIGKTCSCIAVVARDWRGEVVLAISKKTNTTIPLQAEAEALLLGYSTCRGSRSGDDLF
uniref:Reverse transcriptase zinc-binding domain-containing protein n=1 Tax=Fagus sylvatica TaxID=28930 RepID=A0A2N9IIA7_FAGSY